MPLAHVWYLYLYTFHLNSTVVRKHLFRTPNSSHIALCPAFSNHAEASEIHTPTSADVQCFWMSLWTSNASPQCIWFCYTVNEHNWMFLFYLLNNCCFFFFVKILKKEKLKWQVETALLFHVLCIFYVGFFFFFFVFFLNIWRNISVSQLYRGQVPKIWMQYCINLYCTIVICQTNCL